MKAKLLLVLFGFLFLMPLYAGAAFAPAKTSSVPLPATEQAVHRESFGQRLRHLFHLPFGGGKEAARVDTNGWAIASFVCGVVAFFTPVGLAALLGVCAIIFGVLGMKRRRNHGLAVAGFVLGIIVAALTLVVLAAK